MTHMNGISFLVLSAFSLELLSAKEIFSVKIVDCFLQVPHSNRDAVPGKSLKFLISLYACYRCTGMEADMSKQIKAKLDTSRGQ